MEVRLMFHQALVGTQTVTFLGEQLRAIPSLRNIAAEAFPDDWRIAHFRREMKKCGWEMDLEDFPFSVEGDSDEKDSLEEDSQGEDGHEVIQG